MYFVIERINRILLDLEKLIFSDRERIIKYKVKEGKFNGGESINLDDSKWDEYNAGEPWGGYDEHLWFRTNVKIPERFSKKTVVFHITTGREGEWDALNPQFLFYLDGELIQGLDVNHREILINNCAEADKEYNIAFLGYGGLYERKTVINTELLVLDRDIEALYYDIKVPFNAAQLLKSEDINRINILNTLQEAINVLDLRIPYSKGFYSGAAKARKIVKREFYSELEDKNIPTVTAIGHTHLDVAWLWTLSQTREKAARSFSTAIKLMEQYPEYKFMASQPQLYKYIKEDYPELYEKIKIKIKEGQWEADGVMWLEPDCNLASGESFIRQIIFGMRFFKEEFDVTCKTLWLPDVFGYSAALPQILQKSGIKYFMTTKLDWNQFNRIPYDTFKWIGIDGSSVLTHFVTTCEYDENNKNKTRYEGSINASQVLGTWNRYQNKDINKEVLMTFGYGDGGGGANREMLEHARRLSFSLPGMPKLQMDFQGNYFDRLYSNLNESLRLPKWVGELYLEYHRGTYTSMGRNKKLNRISEFLYQNAELLSVVSNMLGGYYPENELKKGWELILLNQFHDILPGSSIKRVYDESKSQYEEVLKIGKNIVEEAVNSIISNINIRTTSVVAFNTLSHTRKDIVEFQVPEDFKSAQVLDEGKVIPSQFIGDGKVIFNGSGIPAKGYKVFEIELSKEELHEPISNNLCVSEEVLENSFFKIVLDKNKNISSIYHKESYREVLKEGFKGNVLKAFEDRPMRWENWDVDIYYREKVWEINDVIETRVIETGPVRGCLMVKRRFCNSIIVQYIYIYNDIDRIDFKTYMDWKDSNLLIKAEFPVDINSNRAAYDIQYGNVERDTHWNTSWDTARFEVSAHKWADLSESGFGVSLLNDCKYGYDIKDGVMRLTLLKCGTYPNEDADKEEHEFTYSIYPHREGWREANTIEHAYNVNVPLYAKLEDKHLGNMPEKFSAISVNKNNVIVEVVKKEENGDGVIVRLYECFNRREEAVLNFCFPVKEGWECDMLENKISKMSLEDNKFSFLIKPYEIKTFLLK
jgi:alpha-mannosidase